MTETAGNLIATRNPWPTGLLSSSTGEIAIRIDYPEVEYVTGAYNRLWSSMPGGSNNSATDTDSLAPEEVFLDGFENGTTSAWSSTAGN